MSSEHEAKFQAKSIAVSMSEAWRASFAVKCVCVCVCMGGLRGSATGHAALVANRWNDDVTITGTWQRGERNENGRE